MLEVIQWRDWLRSPFRKHKPRQVEADDLLWSDPVTGVTFAIKETDYEQLFVRSFDALRHSVLAFPFGNVSEDEICCHLPYPRPVSAKDWGACKQRVRYRLIDFVKVRMGLFYALFCPSKQEWDEMIEQFHVPSPVLPAPHCEHLAAVDLFLQTGKVAEKWKNLRIAIVKAGAVRIKQYFLETNKIQEIRGASRLLEEVASERMEKLCATHAIPESIVYTGGGNTLLVLPEKSGALVAHEIERMYRTVTVTGQSVAVSVTVSWEDLQTEDFEMLLSWVELKKTERQLTVGTLPEAEKPDLHLHGRCDRKQGELENRFEAISKERYINRVQQGQPLPLGKNRPVCESCRLREAVYYFFQYEEKAQCPSCHHKLMKGCQEAETLYLQKVSRLVSIFDGQYNERQPPRAAKDLDDVAKSGVNDLIAVIYGDGNNMGAVVKKLHNFLALRYFSHLTDQVTKLATYTTLMDTDITCQIIAVGGDDIFLVVPAYAGLDIAREIGEKFDQAFATQTTGEGMTLSLGIAYGKVAVPFATLFQTASDLLKVAKAYKKQGNIRGGTVDFMLLSSAIPYTSDLASYRSRSLHDDEVRLFMRPYSFARAKLMKDWILQLQAIPGAKAVLFHLREILRALTVEEARHYYNYFMLTFRENDKQRYFVDQTLYTFRPQEMQNDHLFFSKAKQLYSPWHDLAELWKVYEKGGAQDEA